MNDIGFKIIQEFPNGLIYEFITDSNQKFEVFIPNNYSSDVSIVLYEHSDGGYFDDWESYLNKFSSGECNSVVIRADRRNTVDWYNFVKKKCNLNNNSIINVSFGGSAVYSLRETSEMINDLTNKIPLTILLDGYVPVDLLKQEGIVDNLIKSKAIILCFSSNDCDDNIIESYKKLAIAGVNVILFSVDDSHFSLNDSYMEMGLYEYSIGLEELTDRYTISSYNFSTKTFDSIEYSLVSKIEKVYNYFSFDNKTEEDSLAVLLSSFSAQLKIESLKNSMYREHELFIKPKAVEFVVNYLENIVTSDLESKLAMVRDLKRSDISEVENIVLNAINKCREVAFKIQDIKRAILRYGSLNYDDNDLLILDSFLGNDVSKIEISNSNIDSFYDDINASDDDFDSFDDFDFLDDSSIDIESNSVISSNNLSNNVIYWMKENNDFTNSNPLNKALVNKYDRSFDELDGAVDAAEGHMNVFSAALGINRDN